MDRCLRELSTWGAEPLQGVHRLMGDQDLYLHLVKQFAEKDELERLGELIEKHSYRDAFLLSHSMKGASANLSLHPAFRALVEVVEDLRYLSKTGKDGFPLDKTSSDKKEEGGDKAENSKNAGTLKNAEKIENEKNKENKENLEIIESTGNPGNFGSSENAETANGSEHSFQEEEKALEAHMSVLTEIYQLLRRMTARFPSGAV